MSAGTERDNASALRLREGPVQPVGQGEMAKKIGAELLLVTLSGLLQFGDGHDSRIIHKDMQWAFPRRGERRHRAQIGKVQRHDPDLLIAGCLAQRCRHGLGRFRTSHGQRYLSAGLGERAGGLHTDAGRSTRNDGAASRQVNAFDDV